MQHKRWVCSFDKKNDTKEKKEKARETFNEGLKKSLMNSLKMRVVFHEFFNILDVKTNFFSCFC